MERLCWNIAVAAAIAVVGYTAYGQVPTQQADTTERNNFYKRERALSQYWQTHDSTAKGSGWKQYKRWQWFWEQRLHPTGIPTNPLLLYNAWRKEQKRNTYTHEKKRGREKKLSGNWTPLGPSSIPPDINPANTLFSNGIGRVNCVRFSPTTTSTIWIGTAGGGAWRSSNSGITWSNTTDNMPVLGVSDIAINPVTTAIVYLATGDADGSVTGGPYYDYSMGILKSADGGTTWDTTGLNWMSSTMASIHRLLIHPTNPNILLAATSRGVWRTANGGITWQQAPLAAVRYTDMEFHPNNPSIVYATSYDDGGWAGIYRSTNAGITWSWVTTGLPAANARRIALAVSPANPSCVYALVCTITSSLHGVYRSTDSGLTWSLQTAVPNLLGYEASGTDAKGQGWYDLALAVSPTDANHVVVGGINIWQSTNAGISWNLSAHWKGDGGVPTLHADQHDITFLPNSNSTLLVANDGGIWKSSDAGATWSAALNNGLNIAQLYRMGGSATNASLLAAGAQDNGTALYNTGNWQHIVGGDGMETAIDYTNAQTVYACTYNGNIRRSLNGGRNFTGIAPSANAGAWVTPYSLHPTNPQTLFLGLDRVYRSANQGTAWSSISPVLGVGRLRSIAIAPSAPNTVYTATLSQIFASTNANTVPWLVSWSDRTNGLPVGVAAITGIAVHATNPQQVWVTFSGYASGHKVYRSADGGATWKNYSEGLPNVPANCIVAQSNSPDALYVGTDLGVYFRHKGMNTWMPFKDGLPNVIITELEIHEGAQKLRAATYGRGVWQTDVYPLPPVIVLQPNGGEEWITGSTNTIQWFAQTTVATVHIEYSPTSGATWSNITTTTATTGSFSWIVPNLSSTRALVRISDANNASYSDASDSVYTLAPALTLLEPTDGKTVLITSATTVRWSIHTRATISAVSLAYQPHTNALWTTIATVAATSGSYTWQTPIAPSTQARLRIADTTQATISSSAAFLLANPVAVLAPTSDDVLESGTQAIVQWTMATIATTRGVTIEYSTNAGVTWSTIATAVPSNGGYQSWQTPWVATTQAHIRVYTPSQPHWSDTTEAFTLTPCSRVTISGPAALSVALATHAVYSSTVADNASYVWSVSGGSILSGAGTHNIVVSWSGAGTKHLSVTRSTTALCSGGSAALDVLVLEDNPRITANGTVHAFARASTGTLYLGGEFTELGKTTGGGVALYRTTDTLTASISPTVNGTVFAVAPDGVGGWYIGGSFTHVGGVPRRNLARINADGSLHAWNPNAHGDSALTGLWGGTGVYALALYNDTVYIGGRFDSLGTQARHNAGAVAASGVVTNWNPTIRGGPFSGDGYVYALAVNASTVYIGGKFDTVGTVYRGNTAAVTHSGTVTGWTGHTYSAVYNLELSGATLYMAGAFSSVGDSLRSRLAAITTTGAVTPWNPTVIGGSVYDIALASTTLYIAGSFSQVDTFARAKLAAVTTTGAVTSWNPTVNTNQWNIPVYALAVQGDTVYIGGSFDTVETQHRRAIAALSTTGTLLAWNPDAGRRYSVLDGVYALAATPTRVYAGGAITGINWQQRELLAAIHPNGSIASWNPNTPHSFGGHSVRALALADTILYVGGLFDSIATLARANLAAIATQGVGSILPWNPHTDSTVMALAATPDGATVYAGGFFTSINGQPRCYAAALRSNGNVATWSPRLTKLSPASTYSGVYALALRDSMVYIGGHFADTTSGFTRYSIVPYDTNNTRHTWPSVEGGWSVVRAIASTENAVYIGGNFTGVGATPRSNLAAISHPGTGAWVRDWTSGMDSATALQHGIHALALSGSTLYVGGVFDSVEALARHRFVAISTCGPATPTRWELPFENTLTSLRGINALAAAGNIVYAGGHFTSVGGEGQPNMAIVANTLYPNVTYATLTVLSPNGGELFYSRTVVPITWAYNGTIATVAIEYSLNNGQNWSTTAVVSNTGHWQWLVPDAASVQARVRVRDISTMAPVCSCDESDAVFRIKHPCVNFALALDGINDAVTILATPTLHPASVTAEAWISINSFSSAKSGNNTDDQYILCARNSQMGPGNEGYALAVDEHTQLFKAIVTSSTGTQTIVSSPMGSATTGTWVHLALVANADSLALYINGRIQGKRTTGFPLDSGAYPVFLGSTGDSTHNGYFHGTIDEVRVWNIAKTGADIRRFLHHRFTEPQPGLVGYWKLDDILAGTRAYDESSYNNQAHLDSGATWAFIGNAAFTPSIAGPGIVFASTASYTVPDLYGTAYTWTETNGTISIGQGTAEALVQWQSTGSSIGSLGVTTASALYCETSIQKVVQFASPCTNTSLVFDGVDDALHIYNSGIVLDTAFTVECWLYPTVLDNQTRFIVGTTPVNTTEQPFALAVVDSALSVTIGNGLIVHTVTTASALTANAWHHVAAVFDGTHLVVYVDGEQRFSTLVLAGIVPYCTPLAFIGGGNNGYVAGAIDEMRVWNTVRSQQDIRHAMYRRFTEPPRELLAYWRFDEGIGTTAHDIAAFNDGTIAGATWQQLPFPAPAITGEPVAYRSTAGYVYALHATFNAHYEWSVTGGTITAGQHSPSIAVTWSSSATGRVKVTTTTAEGCSASTSLVVSLLPQPIVVVAPNGGETLYSGTPTLITWITTATAGINAVDIALSLDNGIHWQLVTTATTSPTGFSSYQWYTNNTPSTQALFRVVDATNANIGDKSDDVFTIVSIQPPTNIAAVPADKAVQISWTPSASPGVSAYRIYMRQQMERDFVPIATVSSGAVSHGVTGLTNGIRYTFALTSVVASYESQFSTNADATPRGKELVLLVPNGGERFSVGETTTIRWDAVLVDSVALDYSCNNGATWLPLATALPASDSSYTWVITTAPTANALVRVRDLHSALIDSSEYPFVIQPTTQTTAHLRLFLEGTYSTASTMHTSLQNLGYFPVNQPYTQPPFSYAGNETIGNCATGEFVDWLLVEVRSATTPTVVLAQTAALLRRDGVVADASGYPELLLPVVPNNYYIAVRHRNHVQIMSATTLTLSVGATALYDFSTDQSRAYQQFLAALKPMNDGVFALTAGDIDNDGIINAVDRATVRNASGTMGYTTTDVTLDGIVNAADRVAVFNNRFAVSQVP